MEKQSQVTVAAVRRYALISLVALIIASGIVFVLKYYPGGACKFIGSCPNPSLSPIATPYTQPPYIPPTILDVALDGDPWEPHNLVHLAALAIANQIDKDTRENSGGLEVYVHFITSHSFHDDYISFSIPAIAAFPVQPTPPVCGSDPYQCKKLKDAYAVAYVTWQQTIKARQNDLAALQAKVHKLTDRIRATSGIFDNKGSDIFGAVLESSQHFQNAPAHTRKILVMATDLQSTTTEQETGPFSLSQVSIQIVFENCVFSPAQCTANNNHWRHLFLAAGSSSVTFSDPQVSQAQGIVF